ncbi:MAG: PKD domain-containing protein, partial [Patescibacteria group bacterium]|nr:PKD domain-containing protein [Patescibacteria group bacterium]
MIFNFHRGFSRFRGRAILAFLAFASMPFFFGNGFFALTAQAAPAINTITYTQGAIASPDPVFSREPVLFNAGTTEAEGLTYVWYFGDGESEVGQSVTHLYDAPGTVQVALRLYTGSTEVVARTQNITVQPLRLPADYTTMTEAQKAGQRDRWPYARAARLDGPGAYVAGSNVRFNARFSERNPAAGGLWNPVNTYQWTISGAQGTVAGPIGVNRATDPSGAYSFSAQTPGWYTVVLRTHHLNQAPSDPVPVYDETKYAFLVVPTAAEAGNAAFDAALNSTQQDLDVGSQPEPLPILNYRAVGTVSGGLAPFTYIWNYPNDGKTMEGEPDFITITSPAPTANRTTTLNAEFTKSGTKRIYLTVRDATYREVHKPITYIITNSAEGITPFSPTLDVAATPSPLSISMVEANNQPLTLTLPAGLSAQPQTFVFRATASNGKPPYVFQWTPTGLAPDVPCTKEASFEQCTYRFSSFGPHSVAVTVTDDTSPVQSVTFTQNIMLLSAGEEDSPDGSGGTG